MNIEQVTALLFGYALFGIWGAVLVGSLIILARGVWHAFESDKRK